MKAIRRAAAWILAIILLCMPALAEEVQEETGERSFPGVYGETPEEIIVSAMEVYSWFTICPLDVDPELAGGDGSVFRVADETLCNYNAVIRLLDFTFSEEIVEGLLAYDVYTIIDDTLYGTGGGRTIDPRICEVNYEETYSDEERVVYTVTVHYLGEGENAVEPDVLEFVRERIGGQWLFTQFPFFW